MPTARKIDPYKTLGIDRGADAKTVKAAFRRAARATHPDQGGDAEAFKRVTHANLILSNPERRKRFDETGEDEVPPDNAVANAITVVMSTVMALVQAHLKGGVPDPLKIDMIVTLKSGISQSINHIEGEKVKCDKAIAMMSGMKKQMRAKKTAKFDLRVALEQQKEMLGPLELEL